MKRSTGDSGAHWEPGRRTTSLRKGFRPAGTPPIPPRLLPGPTLRSSRVQVQVQVKSRFLIGCIGSLLRALATVSCLACGAAQVDPLVALKDVSFGPSGIALYVDSEGGVWRWTPQRGSTRILLPKPTQSAVLGAHESCALLAGGDVYCWGRSAPFECGGYTCGWASEVPSLVVSNVKQLALIDGFWALKEDGTVWSWGRGDRYPTEPESIEQRCGYRCEPERLLQSSLGRTVRATQILTSSDPACLQFDERTIGCFLAGERPLVAIQISAPLRLDSIDRSGSVLCGLAQGELYCRNLTPEGAWNRWRLRRPDSRSVIVHGNEALIWFDEGPPQRIEVTDESQSGLGRRYDEMEVAFRLMEVHQVAWSGGFCASLRGHPGVFSCWVQDLGEPALIIDTLKPNPVRSREIRETRSAPGTTTTRSAPTTTRSAPGTGSEGEEDPGSEGEENR